MRGRECFQKAPGEMFGCFPIKQRGEVFEAAERASREKARCIEGYLGVIGLCHTMGCRCVGYHHTERIEGFHQGENVVGSCFFGCFGVKRDEGGTGDSIPECPCGTDEGVVCFLPQRVMTDDAKQTGAGTEKIRAVVIPDDVSRLIIERTSRFHRCPFRFPSCFSYSRFGGSFRVASGRLWR